MVTDAQRRLSDFPEGGGLKRYHYIMALKYSEGKEHLLSKQPPLMCDLLAQTKRKATPLKSAALVFSDW